MTYSTLNGLFDGIRPAKRLTPSEWADAHRFLSSKASAEPGRWRTSRTPYLREILDCFDPYCEVQEVVIMKGAQLGLTEAGYNILGYFIDVDPGPLMYVMPTEGTVKRNTKLRFDPMVEASPRLAEKIKRAKSRDSSNTMFQKDFPGGTVMFAGANSAAGLRSVPVRILLLDEVDAFPVDLEEEGSPIDLAKARSRTFANRKVFQISTPTTQDTSVIDREFQNSGRRYYNVPCPHCGEMQPLRWSNVIFDSSQNPVTEAVYECEGCGDHIEERFKPQMLAAGVWIAEDPENEDPKKRGYHLNSLYSPLGWYSWAEAAEQFMKAKREHSETKLKVFVNTVLGEPWKEKVTVPRAAELYERRGGYRSQDVPQPVAVITAGVDVQEDRIEAEIVGWSAGLRSHSIVYVVLPGRTSEAQVWEDLTALLYASYTRADGAKIGISKMCVDSGFNTQHVYAWCRKHSQTLVVPIKGQPNTKQSVMLRPPQVVSVTSKGKKVGSVGLWNVGVDLIKQEVYGRLLLTLDDAGEAPPGYCYFPEDYALEYFNMLASERLVKRKDPKGYVKYVWEKIQERNEALDCRIYARAGAAILGLDRWSEDNFKAKMHSAYAPPAPGTAPKKKKERKKRSNFW